MAIAPLALIAIYIADAADYIYIFPLASI